MLWFRSRAPPTKGEGAAVGAEGRLSREDANLTDGSAH